MKALLSAYNKAVGDAIKNTLLFGGILVVAVWFSNWTWVSRAAWAVVALASIGDVLTLPSKLKVFKALRTTTLDALARHLQLGMIAAIAGGDLALLAMVLWSGLRVW